MTDSATFTTPENEDEGLGEDLLHYSAVASEPLESASKAPAAEVAASSCLRRAAALAGLGLELWG